MSRIESQPIQRNNSFLATQALVLFYGLSQVADLLISLPRDKTFKLHDLTTRRDEHIARLSEVKKDLEGRVIRVKKGGTLSFGVDDKDYVVYDFRPKKDRLTGELSKGYGLIRHSGKLIKEGNRHKINKGMTRFVGENSNVTIDGMNITHFNS